MGNSISYAKNKILNSIDNSQDNAYTIYSHGDNSYGNIAHLNRKDLNIIQLWCSNFQCFAIDVNGTLMSWGLNDYYQLANGNCINYAFANRNYNNTTISFIDSFSYLSYEQSQYSSFNFWSKNNFPFLGREIKKVDCGDGFSFFLLKTGELYSVGRCDKGQLGIQIPFEDAKIISGKKCLNIPTKVEFFYKNKIIINDITCGSDFGFACDSKQNYYSWGYNDHHQLARETLNYCSFEPEKVECFSQFNKIKQMCCGWMHGCFIEGESIYLWGNPYCDYDANFKDLKIPTKIEKAKDGEIMQISSGFHHIGFIAVENGKKELYMFGLNDLGQLGVKTEEVYITQPVKIEIKDKDIDKEVDEVICGAFHTLCKLKNGNIWGFGQNSNGQVGDYKTDSIYTPIKYNWNNDKTLDLHKIICANAITILIKTKHIANESEEKENFIPVKI